MISFFSLLSLVVSPKTGLGPISRVFAISDCPDFFIFSLIRGVLCLNGFDFLNCPVLVQFDKKPIKQEMKILI